MTSTNDYFVVEQGQKKGPLDLSVLETMRRDGSLSETTLMWRDGMADWQPAQTVVPGIFSGAAGAGIPPTTARNAAGPVVIADPEPTTLKLAHPKWRFLGGVIDSCILYLPITVVTSWTFGIVPLIVLCLYETLTMSSDWQGTV